MIKNRKIESEEICILLREDFLRFFILHFFSKITQLKSGLTNALILIVLFPSTEIFSKRRKIYSFWRGTRVNWVFSPQESCLFYSICKRCLEYFYDWHFFYDGKINNFTLLNFVFDKALLILNIKRHLLFKDFYNFILIFFMYTQNK